MASIFIFTIAFFNIFSAFFSRELKHFPLFFKDFSLNLESLGTTNYLVSVCIFKNNYFVQVKT